MKDISRVICKGVYDVYSNVYDTSNFAIILNTFSQGNSFISNILIPFDEHLLRAIC